MLVLYGWNAKVSHLSSQIHSYFCFMNHGTKQYEAIFTGRRIKESMVLWWGVGDVKVILTLLPMNLTPRDPWGPAVCPLHLVGDWRPGIPCL